MRGPLSSSGGPVGMMVLAPLAAFLISHYSWRTAFLTMGIIFGLTMAGVALWMTKDPGSIGLSPDGDDCQADLEHHVSSSSTKETPQADLTLGQIGLRRLFC